MLSNEVETEAQWCSMLAATPEQSNWDRGGVDGQVSAMLADEQLVPDD